MPRPSSATTILEFGYADQEQPSGRSSLLIAALRGEGFSIRSLLVNPLSRAKFIQIGLNTLQAPAADYVFLRFPYFPWMVRCAILLKKRLKAKLIVDAMVSAYQTVVIDRALCEPNSKRARVCRREDFLVGRAADILIVDTAADAADLAVTFDCRISKMVIVPVGSVLFELSAGESSVKCVSEPDDSLTVLYMGTFVPLHGITIIIDAARRLSLRFRKVRFRFIGEGQDYEQARHLARDIDTVHFTGGISRAKAVCEIKHADIVLGIFGSSIKAKVVVPFKVYDALAWGKPVITARTPATEELLRHGLDSWLISSNPAALADAIELLASDPELRTRLAVGARQRYETTFHSSVSIKPLLEKLSSSRASLHK